MSFDPGLAAAICLVAFAALSFVDGIVLHLWRERLHQRADSRLEHALHSARAVVFPFTLVAFFASPFNPLGVLLVIGDQILEIYDMAIERRSRAHTGGLRPAEYVLHGALITLRTAAIAFALVSGGSAAVTPGWLSLSKLVPLLMPGAVLAALLHLVLLVAPDIMSRARGVRH